jgi:hypothetical protein
VGRRIASVALVLVVCGVGYAAGRGLRAVVDDGG